MKCSICGVDNPEKNQFCSSCGRPLPKPLAGPSPAAKGSGLLPVLLIGGFLLILAVIAVGFFVILPLLDEEPSYSGYSGSSSMDTGLSGDLADSDTYDEETESAGALVWGSGTPALTPAPARTTQVASSTQNSAHTPASGDPVIGVWDLGATGMQMKFGADGTATLTSPATGSHSTGTWEQVSEGHYRLRSASGTTSPDLIYDPLAGLLHTQDYSTVFVRRS